MRKGRVMITRLLNSHEFGKNSKLFKKLSTKYDDSLKKQHTIKNTSNFIFTQFLITSVITNKEKTKAGYELLFCQKKLGYLKSIKCGKTALIQDFIKYDAFSKRNQYETTDSTDSGETAVELDKKILNFSFHAKSIFYNNRNLLRLCFPFKKKPEFRFDRK
jgi:hypothetical protein